MVDDIQLDKRRRQNRDSQRRFRERNKMRRSLNNSNASYGQQHAALNESSAPLCTNAGNPSPEHPNAGIPNDYPSPLMLASCPEGYNDWSNDGSQSIPSEASLYRHVAQNNGLDPLQPGQMSLPPLSEQFSLHDTSMSGANPIASLQQYRSSRHTGGTRRDGMLSPVSLLGSDMGMASAASAASAASKSSRTQEAFLPQRAKRKSRSKAEQMIADVERLHEFGISLSLFPEDPLLRRSLRRMKERFQSLVVLGAACSERYSSDGDCLDSAGDDDQGEDE